LRLGSGKQHVLQEKMSIHDIEYVRLRRYECPGKGSLFPFPLEPKWHSNKSTHHCKC
jgi:hypothetical protein